MTAHPPALAPFLALAPALRDAGLPAVADQTRTFLEAVGLLGPRSLAEIRRAARAVFGPGPDRDELFDAVFDAVFLGRVFEAEAEGVLSDVPPALEPHGFTTFEDDGSEDPSGARASLAERLLRRRIAAGDPAREFARALPGALPRRRSRRFRRARGNRPDAAAAFRQMLRRDGEITRLPTRARRSRQRKVLFLIDVSGSMKSNTDAALHMAHALLRGAERAEVFTLGTRLTRISSALRLRDRDQALERVGGLVADWDGGTRLGEALGVFLSIPRFASLARGGYVIVLSDGLERGGPEALVSAMARMRGLARHILWLNPLAADAAFVPETAAMRGILPYLDAVADGASAGAVARAILGFGRGTRG